MQDDGFLRSFSIQLDMFDKTDLLRQVRQLSPAGQEQFIVKFVDKVAELRPLSAVIIFIDDIENLRDPSELARLLRGVGVQFVIGGRGLSRVEQAFDLDDRARIHRTAYEVEPLPWGEAKQLFDWLEDQLRGAVSFPIKEREHTIDLAGGSPALIASTVKLGIAFALSKGRRLPFAYDTSFFLDAAAEVMASKTRPSSSRDSAALPLNFPVRAAQLETMITRPIGASEQEIAALLDAPPADVAIFLRTLAKRGALKRTQRKRYAGSLVEGMHHGQLPL
jgi:hypothetical protein